MSVFANLIIIIKKVNALYTIYDLGAHQYVRTNILKNYKKYGINELNYYPAIIDSGDPKFIWGSQKFSSGYNNTIKLQKRLKEYNFNISKFFGK